MNAGDAWLGAIAERLKDEWEKGTAQLPERLRVRDLLSKYGFLRRGNWINSRIINRVEQLDLRTVPDFTTTWLDATISIELDPEYTGAISDADRPDPTRRIDSLAAAHNPPVRVSPTTRLEVAIAEMLLHDFSQLPVVSGTHDVKGIIDWQSIGARLVLGRECQFVRQCMEPVGRIPKVEIPKEASLFEAIGIVEEQGYVLVRDPKAGNVISGIVTATDLSNQFTLLAEPFLLIGEIEGHLRNLIHRKYTLEELKAVGGQQINGSADLTLGDYCQLLGKPENWERLKLNIDRATFWKRLDCVRKIRNNIMHFNPDGVEDDQMQILQEVARFFDHLVTMEVI
jgi:CBS domain-containing protein